MICPHCKKPILQRKPAQLKKEALELHKKGYSTRDIESLLERAVSFATVSRWVREK